MADGEKGGEEGTKAAAGLDFDGLDWSCRLKEVVRIEADPEDDDLWRTFSP